MFIVAQQLIVCALPQARIDRQHSPGGSVSAGSRPGSRASPNPRPAGSHDPSPTASAHHAAADGEAEALHTATHAAQSRLAGSGEPSLRSGAGSDMDTAELRVMLNPKVETMRAREPLALTRFLAAVERTLAHPNAGPFAQPVCGPVLCGKVVGKLEACFCPVAASMLMHCC